MDCSIQLQEASQQSDASWRLSQSISIKDAGKQPDEETWPSVPEATDIFCM